MPHCHFVSHLLWQSDSEKPTNHGGFAKFESVLFPIELSSSCSRYNAVGDADVIPQSPDSWHGLNGDLSQLLEIETRDVSTHDHFAAYNRHLIGNRKLGPHARKRAIAHFSADRIVGRYVDFYRRVCAAKSK